MMNAVLQDMQNKEAQLVQTTEPVCPEGGAILTMQACGLCGTDVDKLMQGKAQSVLGHEFVGTIETLSPQAQVQLPHFKLGQRLTVAHHVPCQTCYYCQHYSPSMCRQFKTSNFNPGGFAEKIAISNLHLEQTAFILKDDITDAEGCLIEPLSCCLRAVDRVDVRLGKNLLVVGLGSFGLLSLMSAQYRGYQAMGFDINSARVAVAQKELANPNIFSDQTKLEKQIMDTTNGIGLDAVILSVVNLKTVELALALVRDGGQIILLASTQTPEFLIDQNQLYYREINIISSYSPSLIHLKEANDLVQNRLFPLQFLTKAQYPLSQFNQALQDYQQAKIIKAIIKA